MSTNIVVPKDSADCNQLVSLVQSHKVRLFYAEHQPVFRVDVPAVFWITGQYGRIDGAEDDRKQYVHAAQPTFVKWCAEQGMGDNITVNELSKRLQAVN